MSSFLIPTIARCLLGLLLLPTSSMAESNQTDVASHLLYAHYCSSCHGVGGKGDGTLSTILEVRPADLTQISARNGGVFPYAEVLRTIDGRTTVRAHGSSDMPVWGRAFLDDMSAPLSDQLAGAGRLFLILQHLESLQEK